MAYKNEEIEETKDGILIDEFISANKEFRTKDGVLIGEFIWGNKEFRTRDGFGIDFKRDTIINKEILTPRTFPLEHSWKKLIYS